MQGNFLFASHFLTITIMIPRTLEIDFFHTYMNFCVS